MTDSADRTRPEGLPPLEHYREGIMSALTHGTETLTFDEVSQLVQEGKVMFWPVSERSVILTQVNGRDLHFFVAYGKMAELQAATPHILEEGRALGCTRATLIGRRGWARSFLNNSGWRVSPTIQMEVDL